MSQSSAVTMGRSVVLRLVVRLNSALLTLIVRDGDNAEAESALSDAVTKYLKERNAH